MRVRDIFDATLRGPLMCARRTLGEFPFVSKQRLKVAVIPGHRRCCPCAFQSAGDGVARLAAAHGIGPAKSLRLQCSALRFGANVLGITRTVTFSERMPACQQGNRFFIVHRHSCEGFANISR